MQIWTNSEFFSRVIFIGHEAELKWLDNNVFRHAHSFIPIIITGPPGVGKTWLIKRWLGTRKFYEKACLLQADINNENTIDQFINQISAIDHGDSIIVVIDGCEFWTEEQYEDVVRKIFNYKVVSSLIFTSRKQPNLKRYKHLELNPMSQSESSDLLNELVRAGFQENSIFELMRATKGYPLAISILSELIKNKNSNSIDSLLKAPLYELSNNILIPKNEILKAVPPIIITANQNIAKALKKQPSDLHKLTPREFEKLLAEILADMGWEVELTKQTRDGGTDILAYFNTDFGRLLCLVEAKHYRPDRKIGVDLVRTLYGTLCDAQANSAMLVTSSTFTNDAKEFQQKHKYQLTLRDYADIVTWIMKYGNK